jgi:hypothetical protein
MALRACLYDSPKWKATSWLLPPFPFNRRGQGGLFKQTFVRALASIISEPREYILEHGRY